MNPTKNNCPTIAVLYLFLSIAITLLMAQTPFSKSAQAADYEGFGAVTRGAEDSPGGYETYHVTKLDDDGSPGTLRDAVSQGSRYIVFDVGGTITLTRSLYIRLSYTTIDGSSAPNPGITIDQQTYATEIEPWSGQSVHDIIIHHLRMQGPGSAGSADIWALNGMNGLVYNIIIDHVTGIAAGDGMFDTIVNVHDVTLSWNLMMDTELLMLVAYGSPIENISFHHNVLARNNERQISISPGSQLIDYVNNVIYGWGWMCNIANGLRIRYSDGQINPSVNVENNVFQYLPVLAPWGLPEQGLWFERGPDEGDVYINGNIVCVGETDTGSTDERLPIPAYAEVTKYAASTLGDTVVPFAGTHYPTQEEQDLLNEISIAIGTSGNHAPIANAGSDQTITDSDGNGSEQVTLDGSASFDPDGTIVSYVWSEGGLEIATGINPTVILSTGTHLITFTVTDDGGLTDTDTVTIIVSPLTQPPIADAGPDQAITDSDGNGSEQVTLDGSASFDPDGTIVSYVWSEGGLEIATGINPTVILSTGTHLITFTVTDDGGLTDTDTVTVKVLKGDKKFGKLPRGCYNNVFNPAKGERALIVVELPKQAYVRLNLYNTRGNRIRELADEQKEAGIHKYYWDGRNDSGDVVGSGLYFVHIQAGDYKKTKKIIVVK